MQDQNLKVDSEELSYVGFTKGTYLIWPRTIPLRTHTCTHKMYIVYSYTLVFKVMKGLLDYTYIQ
jgi:hypothetical protein